MTVKELLLHLQRADPRAEINVTAFVQSLEGVWLPGDPTASFDVEVTDGRVNMTVWVDEQPLPEE